MLLDLAEPHVKSACFSPVCSMSMCARESEINACMSHRVEKDNEMKVQIINNVSLIEVKQKEIPDKEQKGLNTQGDEHNPK